MGAAHATTMSKREATADENGTEPPPLTKRQRVERESRARGDLLIRATACPHSGLDFDVWVDSKRVRAISHRCSSVRNETLRLHADHAQVFHAKKFDVTEVRAAWECMGYLYANPLFRIGYRVDNNGDDDGDDDNDDDYVCGVYDVPDEEEVEKNA